MRSPDRYFQMLGDLACRSVKWLAAGRAGHALHVRIDRARIDREAEVVNQIRQPGIVAVFIAVVGNLFAVRCSLHDPRSQARSQSSTKSGRSNSVRGRYQAL